VGRTFLPEEAEPGGKLVAVLNYGLWKRKFGADPQILGKGVALDGQVYTVVGVMPAGFLFPERRRTEVLLPFQLPPKVDWNVGRVSLARVIGRLKSGVSVAQANAELASLSKQTEKDIPAMFVHARDGMQVHTTGLREKLVGDTRTTVLILVIAHSVAERTHEIGIRAALGASRRDVAGMVISQGMAMTAAGIALGLVGAAFATRFLAGLLYGIGPGDPLTLGSAAAILGVVALAACYLPARRAMKVDPMPALRHE
jgi:MacB-like periplasmic core domain/FtsX-like permease family